MFAPPLSSRCCNDRQCASLEVKLLGSHFIDSFGGLNATSCTCSFIVKKVSKGCRSFGYVFVFIDKVNNGCRSFVVSTPMSTTNFLPNLKASEGCHASFMIRVHGAVSQGSTLMSNECSLQIWLK